MRQNKSICSLAFAFICTLALYNYAYAENIQTFDLIYVVSSIISLGMGMLIFCAALAVIALFYWLIYLKRKPRYVVNKPKHFIKEFFADKESYPKMRWFSLYFTVRLIIGGFLFCVDIIFIILLESGTPGVIGDVGIQVLDLCINVFLFLLVFKRNAWSWYGMILLLFRESLSISISLTRPLLLSISIGIVWFAINIFYFYKRKDFLEANLEPAPFEKNTTAPRIGTCTSVSKDTNVLSSQHGESEKDEGSYHLEVKKESREQFSKQNVCVDIDDEAVKQLRNLKSLLDEGIITEEEFEKKKKEILGL